MGYFALVAYQNKDESYDVYTSHNGGEEFYLKPALDKVADGELDRTLTSIEAKKPWEEYSGMPEGVDPVSGTEKPISDSPKYRNIPKSRIPQITDFINVEALYLVHDDTVECYLPVWTYPNVLKALQEMYLLEVYGNEAIQEWQKTGTSPEKSDTEPIRNLKRSDFTPSSVQEPALRRYLERNHLSLFQTSTERQSNGSFTPTKGLFMMDELTLTKPRATDWELDDDRGRGIFVRIPWDEGQGPLFLYHTRRYVESLRIDTSRTTVQSNTETTREELKMVGKLVKHFGNRVSKNAASLYDKYIDSFYESFGAEFTSDGDLYRVIETPSEDTAGFRLRMLDEIVTRIKDLRSLDPEDVVIHTVKTGSDSEYDSLLKTLGRGDIIRAELSTTPDESSTFDSIELVKRFQAHFVTEDSVPDEIYDKYENKLKPELDRSDSDGQHLRSSLSVPDIEGAQIDIGEQIVVADGSSLDLWTETRSGRLSEEIYGGFLKHNDASPAEVIFVNPPSEPFWYGLIYEETPSPYATEIKRKLGISPQS